MFTGIVEEVGALTSREPRGAGARVVVRCSFPALVLGESIAVDGVCLTVDEVVTGVGFAADASSETLARTTLGDLSPGAPVNLERALRADARLGGHVVAGHVDVTGKLLERRPSGGATVLCFELPAEIARFVAKKGSIAVNGVSLTVNAVSGGARGGTFELTVIPHTLRQTTLAALPAGARVNLEADLLARYVARQIEVDGGGGDEGLLRALERAGYK